MDEFSRLELLIKEKINLLKEKKILIIGLGGVGGYALETLVRSGISNIIIVDGDIVEKTNINRQIIALNSTIGMYKVDACLERIKDINPNIKVKVINKYINEDNIDLLFEDKIDYLIDACDTMCVKELIIKNCLDKNIKLISCMGTGNKLNPLKFKIMDLRDTNYDPIAKRLRKYLKTLNTNKKVYVVSSDEEIIVKDSKTIPSISFVPAQAGILLSSYVINDILKGDLNE